MKHTRWIKVVALLLCLSLVADNGYLLISAAATEADFSATYATELTALSAVTDGDGIVTAVTKENAKKYAEAYAAYKALDDNGKAAVTGTDIDLKLQAANLRAEIFTKGVFTYTAATDEVAAKYVRGSDGKFVVLLKNTGYTPELTFVNKLNAAKVGVGSWSNVLVAFDGMIGSGGKQIDICGKFTVAEDNTVRATTASDGKAPGIVPKDWQDFPLINFTDKQFSFGTKTGDDQYAMNPITNSVKWNGTTFAYTISDGLGGTDSTLSGANKWAIYNSFPMTEAQFQNILLSWNSAGFFAIESIRATYSKRIEEIGLEKSEAFVSAYSAIFEALETVTTGDDIVAAVTDANAGEFVAAYEAFLEQDVEIQELLAVSGAKLKAAKMRAEIFTKGIFRYNAATDADALSYMKDSGGNFIVLLKNTNLTPEVTFVNKLNAAKVGVSSWSNVLVAFDGMIGSGGKQIDICGKFTVAEDNAVRATAASDGKAPGIVPKDWQDFPLISFTDKQFSFGTKTGDNQYTMNPITNTVKWNGTTFAYTINDGLGGPDSILSGANQWAIYNSFPITEAQFSNLLLKCNSEFFALESIQVTYPQRIEEIKNSLADTFVQEYELLKAIKNGDFDTAEELVANVTTDTVDGYYQQLQEVRKGLERLEPDMQTIVTDTAYYQNLLAVEKRINIFVKGEFTYDPTADAELTKYLTDSEGFLLALQNVGMVPEITYTRQLAEKYNTDTMHRDEWDMVMGTVEKPNLKPLKFYVYAQRVGDEILAERRDAGEYPGWGWTGAALALDYGWYTVLINFQKTTNDSLEKCVLGTYVDGKYQANALTNKITFAEADGKYTMMSDFTNGAGFSNFGQLIKTYEEYEVTNSIRINTGSVFVLTDLKVTYPEVKKAAELEKPDLMGATIKLTDMLEDQNLRFNAYFTMPETEEFEIYSYGFLVMKKAYLVDAEGNPILLDVLAQGTDAQGNPVLPHRTETTLMSGAVVPDRFHVATEEEGISNGFATQEDLDCLYAARAYVTYVSLTSGRKYMVYSDQTLSRSVSTVLRRIAGGIMSNTTDKDGQWILNIAVEPPVVVNNTFGDGTFTRTQIQAILDKETGYTQDEQKMLLMFALNNRMAIPREEDATND